jgi:hypothetical protein
MPQVFCGCMPPPPPHPPNSAGIFKQTTGAKNRVGIGLFVPAHQATHTAWRNWFLRIDSWAPEKFKNSGSGMLLVQEPEVSPSVSQRKLRWGGGWGGGATGWTLGLDYVQSQPYPHNRHVGRHSCCTCIHAASSTTGQWSAAVEQYYCYM